MAGCSVERQPVDREAHVAWTCNGGGYLHELTLAELRLKQGRFDSAQLALHAALSADPAHTTHSVIARHETHLVCLRLQGFVGQSSTVSKPRVSTTS